MCSIVDCILSALKLSCLEGTVRIMWRTFHNPRRQSSSWRRSWHRKLRRWTEPWSGRMNWRSVAYNQFCQFCCFHVVYCSKQVSLYNPLHYFVFIQISVAELQSLLSELEGRIEGQAINIESLTATLKTKDEIINVRTPPIHRLKLSLRNTQQLWLRSFPP